MFGVCNWLTTCTLVGCQGQNSHNVLLTVLPYIIILVYKLGWKKRNIYGGYIWAFKQNDITAVH